MNPSLVQPSFWRQKRKSYNLILISAFVVSGFFYHLFSILFSEVFPEYELTIFVLAAQTIASLVTIALANIFYCLGPIIENLIPSKSKQKYQNIAFLCGVVFSISLPGLVPLLTLYIGVTTSA